MRRAVDFILIFLICVSAQSFAASVCEEQASAIGRGGRGYLRMVARAIESNDLENADLQTLLKSERPYDPLPPGRTLTNMSLRTGFHRALGVMKPGEWPFVLAELRTMINQNSANQVLVQEAQLETQGVFSLQFAGLELPPKALVQEIFTSSKGETFVYFTEDGKPKVLDLRSGKQIQIHRYGVDQLSFLESSTGEVYITFMAEGLEVHVRRARDLESPFTMALPSIPDLGRYMKDKKGISLFEKNGRVTLAVYFTNPTTIHDVFYRPVLLIDVETKNITKGSLPTSTLEVRRSINGHLYAAGISKTPGRVMAFMEDLGEGRTLLKREYPQYHEIGHKEPIILFDPVGNPIMHAQSQSAASQLFKVGEGESLVVLKHPNSAHLLTDYVDADDKLNYAFSEWLGGSFHFFYGDLAKPQNFPFPLETPRLRQMNVVKGPKGPVVVAWHGDDTGSDHVFALNDFSAEGWLKLRIPARLNVKAVSVPFYDPTERAIFVFIQSRDGAWRMYQLFGREARN